MINIPNNSSCLYFNNRLNINQSKHANESIKIFTLKNVNVVPPDNEPYAISVCSAKSSEPSANPKCPYYNMFNYYQFIINTIF